MQESKPLQILRKPPEAPSADAAPAPGRPSWSAVTDRLREYAAARGRAASTAVERCDLCGAAMPSEHGHLVNVPTRTLLCVCRPCYLLFTPDGAGGARFRAVPERYVALPEFAAAAESWELMQIPIGLAFFFRNSATGRTTAFYPSPAGATEAEVPQDAWEALTCAIPALSTLAVDVEALLVRILPPSDPHSSDGFGQPIALIVPIDACYELVGRIRRAWRGFSGGDAVWSEIDEFLARALTRAERAAGAHREPARV